jgi:hypothetical protein
MGGNNRAFEALAQAHSRFVVADNVEAAQAVSDLYWRLSGGCTPTSHTWASGPWCCCGVEWWKGDA